MAADGSVAPKERVNIVYRPAVGDAQSEVELPLKLLVLGDFTQRANDQAVEDTRPVSVDKDNFNDVLKAQKLELSIGIDSKLDPNAPEGTQLPVKLSFESIDDFSPDALVGKVPELQQLLLLRDALKALKGPIGNIPDFRKRVQELVQDEQVRSRLLGELGIEEK